MRYLEFREKLKNFSVFSMHDIKMIDPHFHRRRLTEWQEKDYITKLTKGYYIFADLPLNEFAQYEIANRLYRPSYVSFETALAFYGFIPESIFGITSVSTRRTYSFLTPIGEFLYRTVKRDLFFGYELITNEKRIIKIASPEKALLDYFYLHPELKTRADFASLRIDPEIFIQKIRRTKLTRFLKKLANKRLTKQIEGFTDFIATSLKE